jgi:hypothetical protein
VVGTKDTVHWGALVLAVLKLRFVLPENWLVSSLVG